MTRCNYLQLPKAASWAPITTDPTQICSISTHLSESPTTSVHLCVPPVHKAQDFMVKIVTWRRQHTRYETPRPNDDFRSGFTDFLLLSCPSVWLYRESWEALASHNVLLANSLVLGSRFFFFWNTTGWFSEYEVIKLVKGPGFSLFLSVWTPPGSGASGVRLLGSLPRGSILSGFSMHWWFDDLMICNLEIVFSSFEFLAR